MNKSMSVSMIEYHRLGLEPNTIGGYAQSVPAGTNVPSGSLSSLTQRLESNGTDGKRRRLHIHIHIRRIRTHLDVVHTYIHILTHIHTYTCVHICTYTYPYIHNTHSTHTHTLHEEQRRDKAYS